MNRYQICIFRHFHQAYSIFRFWKVLSYSSTFDIPDNDRISQLVLKEFCLNRFFRLVGVLFRVTRDGVLSEWLLFAWNNYLQMNKQAIIDYAVKVPVCSRIGRPINWDNIKWDRRLPSTLSTHVQDNSKLLTWSDGASWGGCDGLSWSFDSSSASTWKLNLNIASAANHQLESIFLLEDKKISWIFSWLYFTYRLYCYENSFQISKIKLSEIFLYTKVLNIQVHQNHNKLDKLSKSPTRKNTLDQSSRHSSLTSQFFDVTVLWRHSSVIWFESRHIFNGVTLLLVTHQLVMTQLHSKESTTWKSAVGKSGPFGKEYI